MPTRSGDVKPARTTPGLLLAPHRDGVDALPLGWLPPRRPWFGISRELEYSRSITITTPAAAALVEVASGSGCR